MTQTTAATVATEPVATEAVDLYREVHKGLRLALFELAEAAGALDATDAADVERFAALFADVDMMLEIHHGHEDGEHLRELVARHAPDVASVVDAAHTESDRQLAKLRVLVRNLGMGGGEGAATYDAIVGFTAAYLEHMRVEEQQVMPALQHGVAGEELMAITMTIRTSVPPPQMCVFLRYMLPAMTPAERAATLGGMKAGAPPEVFDLFWGVAEASLAERDFSAVARAIAA